MNPRTTKDKALNLASLAMLDYPCSNSSIEGLQYNTFYKNDIIVRNSLLLDVFIIQWF